MLHSVSCMQQERGCSRGAFEVVAADVPHWVRAFAALVGDIRQRLGLLGAHSADDAGSMPATSLRSGCA